LGTDTGFALGESACPRNDRGKRDARTILKKPWILGGGRKSTKQEEEERLEGGGGGGGQNRQGLFRRMQSGEKEKPHQSNMPTDE